MDQTNSQFRLGCARPGTPVGIVVRAVGCAILLALCHLPAVAQAGLFPPDRPPQPGPLNLTTVPLPANLSEFVADMQAAKVLGKALFWDMQLGSDGLACASCHFQAGADNRVVNQLNPQFRAVDSSLQGVWYQPASKLSAGVVSAIGGGPNYTLTAKDFPTHKLSDPNNRNSTVIYDSPNIVSSQGVFRYDYIHAARNGSSTITGLGGVPKESCREVLSPVFSTKGVNARQVEPRNSPTVINAIYYFRNFWDGRANNIFNGRNPFGMRDPSAGIDPANSVLVAAANGVLKPYPVMLSDASLASQAVGPPGSDLEMSCRGRLFEEIGVKMLPLKPLSSGQVVSYTDSLLGPYAARPYGMNVTYDALVRKAFQPKFWNSSKLSVDGYTQIQKNFSLFFGLAIMLYEATLVSDQSPFDQQMNGVVGAMSPEAQRGFQVFMGNGGCIFCHKGAEFTGAGTSLRLNSQLGGLVEYMLMGEGAPALYDSGFYNIGVRSPREDLGLGESDPWGNPLSFTRQVKAAYAANPDLGLNNPGMATIGLGVDRFNLYPCNFQVSPCTQLSGSTRDAIDGNFKVPTLRNVELTGPYFHNGGQATLEQVVAFYNRGGDSVGSAANNSSGWGANPSNLPPAIFPLFLTSNEQADLVAFLKSLTDERVRWERAPFDHPSLTIPNGHPVSGSTLVVKSGSINAKDNFITLPAIGKAGRSTKQGPLVPFSSGLK